VESEPSPLGRVLVVDDEAVVGGLLRDLLVALGYSVKVTRHGAEALELVPVFQPSVILLDLQMPGMSGTEVLDHLRRDHPELPVVIVSGNQDRAIAERMLSNGAFDYLPKPFGLDILASIVAAAVARAPRER
jgi:CheY-like chemotaxis protein